MRSKVFPTFHGKRGSRSARIVRAIETVLPRFRLPPVRKFFEVRYVVARLERAGYLRRELDPHDGRKQILHLALERSPIQDVIDPLREDVAAVLENFDAHQLTAIAEFLTHTTDLVYRHAALLRAEQLPTWAGLA